MTESDFYISEISDSLFKKMKGKSFKNNCTVPLTDLRYLHVLHKNLEGQTLSGELVCNKKIADILLDMLPKQFCGSFAIFQRRFLPIVE